MEKVESFAGYWKKENVLNYFQAAILVCVKL